MHNWVVVVRNFVLFILLGSALLISGCNGTTQCGETVLQSAASPSGQTTAKVTAVNCGATTDFFTYVRIQTNRVKLRDDGILFGYKGKPEIHVSWSGEQTLQIRCPSCSEAQIYRQVSKEETYRVNYITGSSAEQ